MNIHKLWYNISMRINKDGTPDKRFRSPEIQKLNIKEVDNGSVENYTIGSDNSGAGGNGVYVEHYDNNLISIDPNELHERLLKEHNLQLDFDVVDGVIATKFGMIKLEKPTLVVKASYVPSKH